MFTINQPIHKQCFYSVTSGERCRAIMGLLFLFGFPPK